MKNRLEIKILLLIIAVLLVGFGSYVVISINRESSVLLEQQRDKTRLFSETVMVGIRNVMLAGKAPFARELVNDARDHLEFGTLHVYDRQAREVFSDEARGIIANAGDEHVRRSLRSEEQVLYSSDTAHGLSVFTRIEPLRNEKECQECHTADHRIRGVTLLSLKPAEQDSGNRETVQIQFGKHISATLAACFRNIMVSGRGELMDTLIERGSRLPFIVRLRVYDRFGNVHFGDEMNSLEQAVLSRTMTEDRTIELWEKNKTVLTMLIPLRNEDRCQVCHGQKSQWRGVMEVSIRADGVHEQKNVRDQQLTAMMQSVIGVGFRSMMLVGKGIHVRSFINDVRSNPIVRDLRIFDRRGNERFVQSTSVDYGKDFVKQALSRDSIIESKQWINGEEFYIRFSTLKNENRCQVCHGDDHTIRGVVGVMTSMTGINAAVTRNKLISFVAGAVTIFLVWLVLRLFLKIVVVKPIGQIGSVVQKVGEGDFSVSTSLRSKDEIGQLALRINGMIVGLRERFHLEKFVSRQTVDAVKQADVKGVKLGGERKEATVFFSDVRGFTSFSEKNQPERVVAMLNTILSRQAAIVKKYKGDIDKFVGDELVAVFIGEDMIMNAVRCAIDIQRLMKENSSLIGEDISIGIGINTGEMVMGAMGSDDRMDFTVIGDAVNLGARLCSAAERGQILISEATADILKDNDSIQLIKLAPLRVKGKVQPVQVFEVLEKRSEMPS